MIASNQKSGFFFSALLFLGFTCLLYSCNSLKPIVHNNSEQTIFPNNLRAFDGEYDVLSTDSSYPHLIHALTFCENKHLDRYDHLENFGKRDLKVRLEAIDYRHLKVTAYSHNKVFRTRTLKGEISENYFHFTRSRLSPIFPFFFVLTLGQKHKNRIGLLKNGDLTLDSYEGGILFFVVMPTFGGDNDNYNQVFKRRK